MRTQPTAVIFEQQREEGSTSPRVKKLKVVSEYLGQKITQHFEFPLCIIFTYYIYFSYLFSGMLTHQNLFFALTPDGIRALVFEW